MTLGGTIVAIAASKDEARSVVDRIPDGAFVETDRELLADLPITDPPAAEQRIAGPRYVRVWTRDAARFRTAELASDQPSAQEPRSGAPSETGHDADR